ncbi:MAG: lysophospholipid acyltransferase family protein [Deltaproteobacteria bacterium]|nr:lysophospholipid acyltransferase family protein [Deltaproteobacteria bacterium]
MVVNETISRDLLRIVVWYPLRCLILILPVRWGIVVLQTMGDIHHGLSRGKKWVVRRNLSTLRNNISGDCGWSARAVREYFRNHYIDRLLILIFPKLGVKEVKRFVDIEGLESLNEALKLGKGVILVHGHFGPVHLPLVALARRGYRMKQIGLPSDEGLSWIGRNIAFRLRMKYESMMPAEIIKADSFLRGAFRWLHNNGIIMITGDGSGSQRHLGRHQVFSLFGRPVMFPLGPAILSQKTGAVIIPMFITPGENGYLYKITIEKQIVSDKIGREAVLDITGQFVRRLETYISTYPGYMHFLDRFCPGELIIDN